MTKALQKSIIASSMLILQELENYFQMGYWLPKLDLIIVPQLLFTGMENLGCCFMHVAKES
jgi:aminopeptidase N